MLVRNKDAQEGYIHECRQGKGKPPVYLHDVKAYMIQEIGGKVDLVDVKFCPYCGQEIEKDEYKNERGI